MIKVVNVKKKYLLERGIQNFEEWSKLPNTLYIGRNMDFYVKGAKCSIWHNPYSIKKLGLEKCLELYEQYIKNNNELYDKLEELQGKELGCWCKTSSNSKCHGDILVKLLNEKLLNKKDSNTNYK